jgi:hypothetical protein
MKKDMSIEDIEKYRKEHLEKIKQSKGLGDTVKKVTEKLGIKQCGGCKKRQEKLNRLFPYGKDSKKEE